MNDDTRELSMDELEVISGGGAIVPLTTQQARQLGHKTADGLIGVCDDSV
jgi:hypothetical protein